MVVWMDGPAGGHAQQVLVPLAVAHVLSILTVQHAGDVGIGDVHACVGRQLERWWRRRLRLLLGCVSHGRVPHVLPFVRSGEGSGSGERLAGERLDRAEPAVARLPAIARQVDG